MTGERVERRLAAVLAADVAGYSRLMGIDEEGTLARLKAVRRGLVDPTIASHRGRIVKTTGDGMLVEFASVVDAVRGAVEVQRGMAEHNASVREDERIEFRIGIHVGDIIIDDNDIFGDGVNVAARLEGIAEPGGVCMSNDTYRQVRGKVEIACDDMGPQPLKNIAEPMQVWRVRLTGQNTSAIQLGSTASEPQALPLPDRPSVAVLPFQNMSGDPEQEYFADGMVEEIITALSRFKSLFVIARNSSFTFKGKAVDVKQVGRELGVRYVLEGSVRKAGGRVRITGQLIDAATGAHLWADRFEGDLSDVFELQDRIAESVVSTIAPRLVQSEIQLAARRRPDNLSAYDLYLRALPRHYSMTREGLADAVRLADRALEIDPRYGAAAALAATCLVYNIPQGWSSDPKLAIEEAYRLLRLALSIDDNDPEVLALLGRIVAFFDRDYEAASDMVNKAVELNPNSSRAWNQRGWVCMYSGTHAEEAILSFERAIRLNPLDPMLYDVFTGMGLAFIQLGRFEEAVTAAKKAVRQNRTFSTTYRCLAAALAHLGRDTEAKEAAARLLELEPDFQVSTWIARTRRGQRKASLLVDGLRKAGLPE